MIPMTHPDTTKMHTGRVLTLSIQQKNTDKLLYAQSDFLHQLDQTLCLGVVQDPYLITYTTHMPPDIGTHIPKRALHQPTWMRSLLLVNNA